MDKKLHPIFCVDVNTYECHKIHDGLATPCYKKGAGLVAMHIDMG